MGSLISTMRRWLNSKLKYMKTLKGQLGYDLDKEPTVSNRQNTTQTAFYYNGATDIFLTSNGSVYKAIVDQKGFEEVQVNQSDSISPQKLFPFREDQ